MPGELEAAGGLLAALTQASIAGGTFVGGILLGPDGIPLEKRWQSVLLLTAVILSGSAALGAVANRRTGIVTLTGLRLPA
ncbi:hypothetical protein EHH54_22565 [Rhizobium leguminosarum]|uniref:hypothetical protein n=1 Tax=Rhizobium leguminosarum TaxID=384 RepID=UPI000FEC6DBF|nr:hypothetical protein [Rhizobium leguminosarum]QIO63351.1 hypothetical protein HA463_37535 [Rhizobium leguminosarum bv. trifolii]RWX35695.1 hypothetical protein EHH54_22565 [Rhizobium leguminosarum]